ncbi:hypothetical protein GQ600_25904 [Phytophthora cactorum]|nr:hypothetical protein GQ600_25904 [Phytophthora cactorum]
MAGAEREVATLLAKQEIVTHRDPSGPERRVLRSVLPLLGQLAQQQNAVLVASILQLVGQEAAERLYEVCHTVLLLSYSSEKNVVLALQLALKHRGRVDMEPKSCWDATIRCIEATADVVANPPETGDNNRSAMVWLRAWKLLESGVMLFSTAQDASVYRDPMRSNVQPNACSLDRLSGGKRRFWSKRSWKSSGFLVAETTRAECGDQLAVAVAAVRPQHMPHILPRLIAISNAVATTPGMEDAVMQKTLTANLVKLLSHPAAQPFADEVTDILIAVGASQRAFAAISKSKEQRRRARIGKRTAAQSITERVENANAHAKRRRVNLSESSAAPVSREKVTHDGIVNMQAVEVANVVLESFASDMPLLDRLSYSWSLFPVR